jgi:hypothetical protein
MDDGSDEYLSRYLKNWAVQQRPLASARERLLKTAASPSISSKPPFFSVFKTFILPKTLDRPMIDRYKIPMTQSRMWSFHISMELRLVT